MAYQEKERYAVISKGGTNIFLNSLLDYFLPRFCVSCSEKLSVPDKVICNQCLSSIKTASDQRIEFEYIRKFSSKNIISDIFSTYIFERDKELQKAIHALKYGNNFLAGKFFGEILAEGIKKARPGWIIDLVIPIPLHHLKQAERGYNQSSFIARGMKKILDVRISPGVVRRTRFTESQTSMSLAEREKNISGAFKVKYPSLIKNRSILLIDDVITTGATISECGRILLRSGAGRIYAASVGIAD